MLLCGLQTDMLAFIEHNKNVSRLFELEFRLDAFKIADLTELCLNIFHETYNLKTSDDLPRKLNAHFGWFMRQKDISYLNGHLAENVAESVYVKVALRSDKTVVADDIDTARRGSA